MATPMEVTEPVAKLLRATTMTIATQQFDDCAVYAITNAFMRKIILEFDLGWNSEPIDWDETDPNTCDMYALSSSRPNPIQEQYCILYTYIQRLLRKNFGSCGLYGEPAMISFCDAFNIIMAADINRDTIEVEIIDIRTSIDQYQEYIRLLESVTERILLQNETEELAYYKRRVSELTHEYYNPKLLDILKKIQIQLQLQGRIFSISTFVIKAFPDVPDHLTLSQDNFDQLKYRFMRGEYGVMSLEFDTLFSNKFQSIHNNSEPDIINAIIEKVNERELERQKQKQKKQEQKKLIKDKIDLETQKLNTKITKKRIAEIDKSLTDNNDKLLVINEEISSSSSRSINDELIELLENYFDLPSGLKNSVSKADDVTMFDTFYNMIDTKHNLDDLSGHAVVIQHIFRSIAELDLGDTFCKIKNTWSSKWGINGYLICPKNIFAYAHIKMFNLAPPQAKKPASDEVRPCIRVFQPHDVTLAEIARPQIRRRRDRRLPNNYGGKRSRKNHRKSYRKKYRKTNRKRTNRKFYQKKYRKSYRKNLK